MLKRQKKCLFTKNNIINKTSGTDLGSNGNEHTILADGRTDRRTQFISIVPISNRQVVKSEERLLLEEILGQSAERIATYLANLSQFISISVSILEGSFNSLKSLVKHRSSSSLSSVQVGVTGGKSEAIRLVIEEDRRGYTALFVGQTTMLTGILRSLTN